MFVSLWWWFQLKRKGLCSNFNHRELNELVVVVVDVVVVVVVDVDVEVVVVLVVVVVEEVVVVVVERVVDGIVQPLKKKTSVYPFIYSLH